ncbi:MAG: response regulator [Proteobacteria bacterium]|nr:response regulator [Pseudomonadota bacterium]
MNEQKQKTILLVEDEALIAVMEREMLERHGFNVILASSGEKAINTVRDTPAIDLILMDINLGRGMDGTEAAEIILKEKNIPILFLSSYTQAEVVQKTEKIASYGYVVKSSGETVLITSIKMAFKLFDAYQRLEEREEALYQAEKKYRSIFDNVIEGIFQITPEERYLTVNPQLARIYGYSSPEEMIETITDVGRQIYVNPDERLEFLRILQEKGLITGFEVQLKRKDGSPFWVSINARCVYDENGNILYYDGTSEDITNRKHLESQLFQSQKMEAIGTLAGGVAHDFNNILTAITGFGGLLKMDMREDDPNRAFVDEILASSERAANLTHSLLAFSRKQQIILKPLGINNSVKETSKLLKRLLTEDIELKIRLSEKTLVIMGDATQIDQVLINLAANARDAMPTGGTLSIETKMVTLDDEFIGMHGYGKPGKYALLSASDTGIGMDEATKARIFDPFFTTKEIGKGTGLGLSTVYGIVKQHNGYITVYSEHGHGTTFRIYLPSVDIEKEQKASPVHNIKKGSETILMAEDDPGIRNFTREILQRYGYTIIEAIDGEEAVRTFMENRNRIDLIILDVVMPGKNGKEVYDEIVKTDPGMKFLFTSGYTGDVILDKGIMEDTVNFISKPLLPNELLKKIRDVLDG